MTSRNIDAAYLNRLTAMIIGAAIEVHRYLGPGLLESAYELCLLYELERLGLRVERQKGLPLVYKEIGLEIGYRVDLLVEGLIVVEIKAVENILPVHEAQVLTYGSGRGCRAAGATRMTATARPPRRSRVG